MPTRTGSGLSGASVHACIPTRPGHQGVGALPWTQRSPAKSHLAGRVKWSVRGVVSRALGLMLTGVGAQAADLFHRLSAREIHGQIVNNVIPDDTHWSQHVRPDGPVHSLALSRLRQGT